jgi:hypothetical protein
MGLVEHNYMYPAVGEWQHGSYSSLNNIVRLQYALEDPESNTFSYTFNSLGLPVTQVSQAYDFNEPSGNPITATYYYYQGDIVP